jgi:hypothetical protein
MWKDSVASLTLANPNVEWGQKIGLVGGPVNCETSGGNAKVTF